MALGPVALQSTSLPVNILHNQVVLKYKLQLMQLPVGLKDKWHADLLTH